MQTILLDLTGLAEWLKVSESTAYRLSKHFPCLQLGDRIKRFDPEEIAAYLRQERARQEQHSNETAGLHPRKLKVA